MNNELLINSARVLGQDRELILALLIGIGWGTLLVFAALKKTAKQVFTDTELMALALGGWPLPALLISLLIVSLLPIVPVSFIFIGVLIFMAVSAGFALRAAWKDFTPGLIFPIFIFLILFFLRLGFIAKASLPPYFDSAEHYRIIQNLLSMEQEQKFIWPAPSYYHVGYHIIVAAFTCITNGNIAQAMLLFGQAVLAAIPFPVYFFVRRVTGSNTAAFFGSVLAAFGWFMPAHAINWGKYPALLGLLLIQFSLGAVILKNRRLMALGIFASVLIHTRIIILLGIFGLAWMLSGRIQNKRILFFALAGTMLGMTILLFNRNQVIGPIFEPYRIWVTLLVVLLSVSVARSFPRLIFFSTLIILGMFAASLIPVSSSYTLLDRPLVEMMLFLPLAFLGGLGSVRLPKYATTVFAVFIIFHAWMTYNFSPSECCQLADRDDVAALGWINKQLPADAHIAIASADLSIDAFSAPMQAAGTDAGIWVTPLTGRASLALPYYTDFLSQEIYELLCHQQVTHIYIGSRPQSFKADFVQAMPARYETILKFPKTQIVQVTGCNHE